MPSRSLASSLAFLAALVCLGFGPMGPPSRHAPNTCLAPLPRRGLVMQRMRFGRVDNRPLRLDLVTPMGPGPHPLVVLVHGGAWRRGHRSDLRDTMRRFAAQGFAAATVDYRLADGARRVFPGPVSDVRCAVRTLRARAPELGLDPSRFAAMGFSAGGHLSAMLATASDQSALDEGSCPVLDVSPAVQAGVSFYGPHDLRAPLRVGPGAEGAIRNFLGVSRRRDPRRTELASPIAHVDPRDPPMLLVHGVRDRIVEIDQSRRMARALRDAGVGVDAIELPHHRHGFGVFPRQRHDDPQIACSTLDFLRRQLRQRPALALRALP